MSRRRLQRRFFGTAASARRTALVVGALAWLATPASGQPPVVEHYVAAMKAREADDCTGYVDRMQAACMAVPGHAILMRHVAQGQSLCGRFTEALNSLQRVAATGAYFDLASYPELDTLRTEPGFAIVHHLFEENRRPQGAADIAFEIPDPRLIPEGIAYDPQDDVYYVSSVHKRKIVRIDATGAVADFFADTSGFYAGLGMKVDSERRRLWAVTSAFRGMQGYEEAIDGHSSVSCFDVRTGERIQHIVVGTRVGLNDIELHPDGHVLITGSTNGALYRLDAGDDSLTTILPPGSLRGPNGVALDAPRNVLYVSQWGLNIIRVALSDSKFYDVRAPAHIATYGVDGLYFRDNGLLAVQNHPSLERIVRFELAGGGTAIVGAEVLVSRLDTFEEPTTGVLVDGRFVFIGNSQIERFTQAANEGDLEPVRILFLDL